MNIILIIIILILLLTYSPVLMSWSCSNIKETFDIVPSNQLNNYQAPYEFTKILNYTTELVPTPKSGLKCCLVEKKYVPEKNNLYGGKFKYEYKSLENENCDLKLFRLDSNKQLYIEGENNWSNQYCTDESKKLGSCRNVNKECIDFVTKDFCDNYKMVWSDKTCNDPIEYKWEDKINFVKPETNTDNTFRMF